MPEPGETELTVDVDGARLAGSVWLPPSSRGHPLVRSLVFMIPGSGPSTRHNEVLFGPIRSYLLDQGHAVAAFDKRGAGASTGSLVETTIHTQMSDAIACIESVGAELGGLPIGVFGHSQGGWVAYEIGAHSRRMSFIISNSGPAVSPEAQERFRLFGSAPTGQAEHAAREFDQLVKLVRARSPFDDVRSIMHVDDVRDYFGDYLETSADDLPLMRALFDYSPVEALRSTTTPTLVIHGLDEAVIPVAASAAVLEQIANPVVRLVTLASGDHRLQCDGGTSFVPGYFAAIGSFLDEVVTDR